MNIVWVGDDGYDKVNQRWLAFFSNIKFTILYNQILAENIQLSFSLFKFNLDLHVKHSRAA